MRPSVLRVFGWLASLALLSGAALSGACSLLNSPDEVQGGTSGASGSGSGGGGGDATTGPGGAGGTGSGGDGGTGGEPDDCEPDDCDDDDACTTEVCKEGECVNEPVAIDDGDACTVDACDPATGDVSHDPKPDIDDGDACTVDACDPATGDVSHDPKPDIDDANVCTVDACDPATGDVSHTDVDIDDNNACTDDSCDPVTGPAHHPKPIDDGQSCTEDKCDPATGNVTHEPIPGCFCAHSLCIEGKPLQPAACTWGDKNDCVQKVCAVKPECCDGAWSAECVDLVKTQAVCPTGLVNPPSPKYTCTCVHSYCKQGGPLHPACDPCVKKICENLPQCCDKNDPQAWKQECVDAVTTLCQVPPGGECN